MQTFHLPCLSCWHLLLEGALFYALVGCFHLLRGVRLHQACKVLTTAEAVLAGALLTLPDEEGNHRTINLLKAYIVEINAQRDMVELLDLWALAGAAV